MAEVEGLTAGDCRQRGPSILSAAKKEKYNHGGILRESSTYRVKVDQN